MYKYDMFKTFAAGGRAARKRLDDIHKDPNAKDAPPTKALKNNKMISKDLNWWPEQLASDHPLAAINEEYCSKCRRVFEGTGDHAINLLQTDKSGMFFQHWDGYFLEKSARRGCPLCNIVLRKHDHARFELARGEEIPMRYDFGSFMSTDETKDREIFAVRFYPFTLLEEKGQVMPCQLPLVTIHLEPAAGLKQSLRSSPGTAGTDSAESMKQLSEWLGQCENEHTACGERRGIHSGFVPERLISVGDSETSHIRILRGKDIPYESKYVTLSHCWGSTTSNQPFVLLESNISNFMEKIPMQELPKTFAHACSVARAIDIRYIWIDSLCIIQDSKDDWRRHAGIMWEVYSNSYLNLSATASRNSSGGLFRKRHPATLSPGIVIVPEGHAKITPGDYVSYSDDELLDLVDNAPVNTRAWVCQERLLSPRIVHFSRNQLFWECQELRASERFPGGVPSRYESSKPAHLFQKDFTKSDPRKLLEIWQLIVNEYTACDLTYSSDKLVAVSALAKHVSAFSQVAGEYLGGLWKDQIVGQLCWSSSSHTTRPKEYRAPSWSWACLDGPIWPRFDWSGYGHDGYRYGSKHLVEVIDARVTSDGDPFASVTAGELRISGPLYSMTVAQPEKPRERGPVQTAQQRRADIVKHMAEIEPGFTGENMISIGVSDGPTPTGSQLLEIDANAGLLVVDDSESSELEKILDSNEAKRDFKMDLGQHKGDLHLDEDIHLEQLTQMELVFLPVLCYNALDRVYNAEGFKIESIAGLVLTEAEGGDDGVYRRVGVGMLDDHGATEFFCNLGNQELDSSFPLKGGLVSDRRLKLEDFVPRVWPGKELEFVPKDFACYLISVI